MSLPVLVLVSAQGSANERNWAPASTIFRTIANRSNVERASRSIRVTNDDVAPPECPKQLLQLLPIQSSATQLFTKDRMAIRSG